ncbi:hypothetical protein ACFO5Q_15445 [Kordiimonas lipolytica]|uniref:Lectin-like protein BA14k n=1 Tax=Kordiimonas lipolytica TaxID=1662421 RepID=A0ABV8UF15_9PROT|nr:hypothetical protein [Kordiimonas lipolytica]
MTRLFSIFVLAAGGAFWAAPASAQYLSDGDYEECSVYDADGDFVGYSNECLERKRAIIRRYQDDDIGHRHRGRSSRHADTRPTIPAGQRFTPIPTIRPCPVWANAGQGYPSTMSTSLYGQYVTYFGTFDSMVNGRRCSAQYHFTRPYN